MVLFTLKKKNTRQYKMKENGTRILVHETVLSYPSSLEELTVSLSNYLQETRIRLSMFCNEKYMKACIRLEFILN